MENVDARIQQGLNRGLTADQMLDENSPDYVLDKVPSKPSSAGVLPWEVPAAQGSGLPWEIAADPSWVAKSDAAVQRSINHIQDSFLGGLKGGFGDEPVATPAKALPPELEKTMKDYGVFNDYRKGQGNFLNSLVEGLFKGSAAGLELAGRAANAAISGIVEAAGQAGEELGLVEPGQAKGSGAGAGSDPFVQLLLGGAPETAGVVNFGSVSNARRAANLETDFSKARAVGTIGEGDAGHFDAIPVSPENMAARETAAEEVNAPLAKPLPPPADVHELARRVDPETMQKFDALSAEKEHQQETIRALVDHGVADNDPALLAARQKFSDADAALVGLLPDVNDAYHQAHNMLPNETEAPAATATEETKQAAPKPTEISDKVDKAEKATAPPGGPLKAVVGTGETKTRALAEGVEAKAIEEKLTSTFGDLPEYKAVSMADQAEKAAALLDKDYEGAKAVAMGQKRAPAGVFPESVFVAVEKRALAEGDVDTLYKLATGSRLSTEATTMGQRIRTLGERDQASPIGAIQEVQQAREANLAGRMSRGESVAPADEVKAMKEEMKAAISRPGAAASDPSALEKFIRDVTCK